MSIPQNVTNIGTEAFSYCSNITSVEWNAKRCNKYQFGSQVESFTFGEEVEVIPSSICWGMNKLTSIVIPNSVASIGDYAFYKCSGLTNLSIPDSVTRIGESAFCGCSGLTSVTIGKKVTDIGWSAFESSSKLTSLTNYSTTPQTIVNSVFKYVNKSICTLYVPKESVDLYKTTNVWKAFKNIAGINVTPDNPTFIDNIETMYDEMIGESRKILHKGKILIRYRDKTYTLQGQEIIVP